MNSVTLLKATCERDHIVNLFERFANKYGTLWTSRLGTNSNWERCIDDWYEDLKRYDYQTLVRAAKSALNAFTAFPPTFGQFEDLCKKFSGFLQLQDAIRMMINRDFSHPIVKMMYDNIGSWTLSNGKEGEIQAKAKEAYEQAQSTFSLFPDKSWAMLNAYHAKPKELSPPAKIPSSEERRGFKDRMAEFQKKFDDEKINCKGRTYKEFDAKKINPIHDDFDPILYEEFKCYLLSIEDNDIMILPPHYIYQRMKFIAQREQPQYLKTVGYVGPSQRDLRAYDRNKGPTHVSKQWMND